MKVPVELEDGHSVGRLFGSGLVRLGASTRSSVLRVVVPVFVG